MLVAISCCKYSTTSFLFITPSPFNCYIYCCYYRTYVWYMQGIICCTPQCPYNNHLAYILIKTYVLYDMWYCTPGVEKTFGEISGKGHGKRHNRWKNDCAFWEARYGVLRKAAVGIAAKRLGSVDKTGQWLQLVRGSAPCCQKQKARKKTVGCKRHRL